MTIHEIIGRLLAFAALALLGWIAPKARAWLVANTDKTTQDNLEAMVRSFARAAEQLYKETDPDGTKRNRYVLDQLRAVGYQITDKILDMIEAEVWAINTETKKAQVQDKELNVNTTVALDTGDGHMETIFKGSTNGTAEAEAEA